MRWLAGPCAWHGSTGPTSSQRHSMAEVPEQLSSWAFTLRFRRKSYGEKPSRYCRHFKRAFAPPGNGVSREHSSLAGILSVDSLRVLVWSPLLSMPQAVANLAGSPTIRWDCCFLPSQRRITVFMLLGPSAVGNTSQE